MAARKKSDAYVRLEAVIEGLVAELIRGLVELFNTEIPAQVRAALADLSRPDPKAKKKRPLKKARRKRSPG
jgi:hypothetical protein